MKNIIIFVNFIMIQSKMISGFIQQQMPIGNCLIHNQKYSFEYLYASDKVFTDIIKIQNPHRNIFTNPIGMVDDFNRLKWTITQVNQSNVTVTIKSNNNEYLCSSDLHQDILHQRRRVYLKTMGKNRYIKMITPNCQWRLQQVGVQSYIIWNDWFNEPLYAPSFFYKHDLIKRNVYLWKHKPSSSKQFIWSIDCSKGKFLLE